MMYSNNNYFLKVVIVGDGQHGQGHGNIMNTTPTFFIKRLVRKGLNFHIFIHQEIMVF